jgi:hypothetical protein
VLAGEDLAACRLQTPDPNRPGGPVLGTSVRPTATLVLLAAAALLAVPTTAAAAEDRFPDARGDTRSPADIVAVTLEHSDRVVVRVHHRDLTFRAGAAPATVRVVYAVPGHSPGPDFWLKVAYQSDPVAQLRSAGDWGDPAGPWVPGCTGERVRVSTDLDVTRVSVPRACFGDPDRIRVNVRVTPHLEDVGRADNAPGAAQLGPWVGYSPA